MTDNQPPKTNGVEPPTEMDPCMQDETKSPRKERKWQRYRDDVCEKTELTKRNFWYVVAVFAACLVLLAVVVALAAAWPTRKHRDMFPVCRRPECISAAAQIRESINEDASPCTDLWNFTCGGWLAKHPLPKDRSHWDLKQQLVYKEYENVRNQISTFKLPLKTSTVEWKLKYLYEACMNVDNIEGDKDKPLTNIISELGGWYVLRNWNDADFDRDMILTKLHVDYGVTPFFQITVEPNPRSPGQNSIRISPAGLGLPTKDYYYRDDLNDRVVAAYKELIRDVIIPLNTASNEATKFGIDMFSYEKRIAEITPDPVILRNPIHTYNVRTLSELKETVQLPLFDILTGMYPESGITLSSEVIVTSPEYLQEISVIVSSTDRKTMNGYLIWTLVRSYLPYLSSVFTSSWDTFNAELYGVQRSLERWETCARITRRFMGLASDALKEIENPLTVNVIRVVNDTFQSILDVAKTKLIAFEHNSSLYSHLRSKLNNIRIQIGLPERIKKSEYLENYYKKLQIIKLYFFESIKNGIKFKKKMEELSLIGHSNESTAIINMVTDTPIVSYSSTDNKLFIPRTLLSVPNFDYNYPSSIIYGRLGVEIANAVLSSILPYGSLWTGNNKLLSYDHNTAIDSLKSVGSSTECLSKFILNLNLDVPAATVNETSLELIKQFAAVKLAHEALLKSLESDPHVHQPTLEQFEDSALFFLSYSQTQCSETANQQQTFDRLVNFKLSQKTRLHLLWSQHEDFARSFDCDTSKKLKCRDSFSLI
ncbi:protein gone early [Aethina tumida]|uniref:protein gone early n=1 Tax=Aethina tumida TaxID=116153 RepID=UPI002148F0CE|nr:protein gone early [Aethina tumida]